MHKLNERHATLIYLHRFKKKQKKEKLAEEKFHMYVLKIKIKI